MSDARSYSASPPRRTLRLAMWTAAWSLALGAVPAIGLVLAIFSSLNCGGTFGGSAEIDDACASHFMIRYIALAFVPLACVAIAAIVVRQRRRPDA